MFVSVEVDTIPSLSFTDKALYLLSSAHFRRILAFDLSISSSLSSLDNSDSERTGHKKRYPPPTSSTALIFVLKRDRY